MADEYEFLRGSSCLNFWPYSNVNDNWWIFSWFIRLKRTRVATLISFWHPRHKIIELFLCAYLTAKYPELKNVKFFIIPGTSPSR